MDKFPMARGWGSEARASCWVYSWNGASSPAVINEVIEVERGRDILIREILAAPDVSFWLKRALIEALKRDYVDAARDAEILAEILKHRCSEIMREWEPNSSVAFREQ